MSPYVSACLVGVELRADSGLEIDHFCWRCTDVAEYARVKAAFCQVGECIVEGIIGGRPIATVTLHTPLVHAGFSIRNVEIPAPKPGRPYASGLEHVEVCIVPHVRDTALGQGSSGTQDVSPSPSLDDILTRQAPALLQSFMDAHPHIAFDTAALKKDINQDVSLSLSIPGGPEDAGGDGGGSARGRRPCVVKFHCVPLDLVVAHEKAHGLVEHASAAFTAQVHYADIRRDCKLPSFST